jgi:hypothetical protein
MEHITSLDSTKGSQRIAKDRVDIPSGTGLQRTDGLLMPRVFAIQTFATSSLMHAIQTIQDTVI